MLTASSLKNVAIIFMLSYFSLAHSMLATSSDNKENTINQYTGNYTFYDSNNNILARLPKSTIYKLSEVIAKSAHFGDHDHFVIDITDRLTDKISELLPESWALFLQYLQAHQQEVESDKNNGAVYQALEDISDAPAIVLLDLVCFSLRYRFSELQEYLIPYVGKIWNHYKTDLVLESKKPKTWLALSYSKVLKKIQHYKRLNKEQKDIKSLESFVDKLYLNKDFFKKVISKSKRYCLSFYLLSEDIIDYSSYIGLIDISSDNKFIVFASNDETVQLYDREKKEHKVIITHNDPISSIALSNDGRYIASGSQDGKVKFYDATTQKTKTIADYDYWVTSIAISKDSKYIIWGCCDQNLYKYDITTEKTEVLIAYNDSNITSVAISNDNNFFVLGFYNGSVKLYDTTTNKIKELYSHSAYVRSIAISNDGKYIASGSDDRSAYLYNMTKKDIENIINHNQCVVKVAISNYNRFLVFASNEAAIIFYDIANKDIKIMSGDKESVSTIALSNDNQCIVTSSLGYALRSKIRILGDPYTLDDHNFFDFLENLPEYALL